MAVRIERGVGEEIRAHAVEGLPQEVCGLLVGAFRGADVHVVRARRAPNAAAASRGSSFALHPRDILAAEDELEGSGLEIVGFYHSHPDVPASPSGADQEDAWPSYLYAIVSVLAGEARHLTFWRRVGSGRLSEQTVVSASRPGEDG